MLNTEKHTNEHATLNASTKTNKQTEDWTPILKPRTNAIVERITQD